MKTQIYKSHKDFLDRENKDFNGVSPSMSDLHRTRNMGTTLRTAYFTFGQDHTHRVNGITFDCDVVVKIVAPNPRERMFDLFGNKWAFEYGSFEKVKWEYFPRGMVTLQ